jgi:NAD+ diphosphatase
MKELFTKGLVEPLQGCDESYWFIFQDDKLLVKVKDDGNCDIPLTPGLSGFEIVRPVLHYLGTYGQTCCYALEVGEDFNPPENMEFNTLRQLFYRVDEELFSAAGYAFQVIQFEQTHRFCGQCGSKIEASKTERAKVCPACGLINYPRVSPSMIVAVLKGDQILLARSTRFKSGFYSVLAGFVEQGETLEECVKREVREEVGIEVKNIRYFGSQPWPFPHSLMVGFIADYESGELKIDPVEIVEAGWFSVDALPEIPGKISIARRLIDWFINRDFQDEKISRI